MATFEILEAALLRVRSYYSLAFGGDAAEPEDEPIVMADMFDQVTREAEVTSSVRRVEIAGGMQWVKAACGSLIFGIRLDDKTVEFELFGGTDTDRNFAGDSDFWREVEAAAPSVSGEAWRSFCEDQGLAIEQDDEDDADYPNAFLSIFVLSLALRLGLKAPEWQREDGVVSFQVSWTELKGTAWTRAEAPNKKKRARKS